MVKLLDKAKLAKAGSVRVRGLQVRPFQSRLAAPKARPDDGFPTATSPGGGGRRRKPIVLPLISNKTSYHKLQDPQSWKHGLASLCWGETPVLRVYLPTFTIKINQM